MEGSESGGDGTTVVRNVHDVHELAAEAAAFEASVEKCVRSGSLSRDIELIHCCPALRFLDDALITEMRDTPLLTIDSVLEERRDREERVTRVQTRAKELLADELTKAQHEREVKQLEEAISTSQQPTTAAAVAPSAGGKKNSFASASRRMSEKAAAPAVASALAPAAAPDAEGASEMPAAPPIPLESAGRSAARDANPYVLNLTDFVAETEANRQVRELRAESELLRKCLQEGGQRPKAFESFLRRSTAGI